MSKAKDCTVKVKRAKESAKSSHDKFSIIVGLTQSRNNHTYDWGEIGISLLHWVEHHPKSVKRHFDWEISPRLIISCVGPNISGQDFVAMSRAAKLSGNAADLDTKSDKKLKKLVIGLAVMLGQKFEQTTVRLKWRGRSESLSVSKSLAELVRKF
ncbi:MAG: hypothetical protein WC250_01835 [Candidatus Paceibacterota bacterium]